MAKIMQLIRSTDAAISKDLASGLDAEFTADPIPLPDLSPVIGVSRERIRQIEVKALAKVSKAMCEGRAI